MNAQVKTTAHNRATKKNTDRENRSNALIPLLWYNTMGLDEGNNEAVEVFERSLNQYYSGLVIEIQEFQRYSDTRFHRHDLAVLLKSLDDLALLNDQLNDSNEPRTIVLSEDLEVLEHAINQGLRTCFYIFVDDKASLHRAIHLGAKHPYVLIKFKDPTNIPLELVIAELQSSSTVVIKEIEGHESIDDVLNSMSTMEFGVEGLVVTPIRHDVLDSMYSRFGDLFLETIKLETAEIIESKPIGDGIRGCVDLSTMFAEDEGIIVGSTSQGGFMCCPEVFEMPYMNKREFRVNAGGVHSYVFSSNNRTQYMSELKAGESSMVVDMEGRTRLVPVGRVKLEKRPLRLLRAKFASGEQINIFLQDDWHVRIYSDEGKPLHITDLVVGSKVKAFKALSGRHVGVPVKEYIEEV